MEFYSNQFNCFVKQTFYIVVYITGIIYNSQDMEAASLQCPLTDEWYVYTPHFLYSFIYLSIYLVEYYSAINKNKILPGGTT